MKITVLISISALVLMHASNAAAADRTQELVHGSEVSGIVPLPPAGKAGKSFDIEVPADCRMLSVRMTDYHPALVLEARHAGARNSEEDVYLSTVEAEQGDAVLEVDRDSEPPLKTGRLSLTVAVSAQEAEIELPEGLAGLPFRLEVFMEMARIDGAIAAGAPVDCVLDKECRHFRTYTLDLPEGIEVFRVDVIESDYDVDLFVARCERLLSLSSAGWSHETEMARESLVAGEEGEELDAGTYMIHVRDPGRLPFPFTARIQLTMGKTPPKEALAFPDMPSPPPGLALALAASVNISTRDGFGSGTVISPEGAILTAEHVIRALGGEPFPDGKIVISFTQNPKKPARECFRAKVLFSDHKSDLAILIIVSGLHDQPLPKGYRFPFLPFGDAPEPPLGDQLLAIGYPETGTRWNRGFLTLTRGVLSGFDAGPCGVTYKTDARVHCGCSGGAVLDSSHRFVGVVIETVREDSGPGFLGYVMPVSAVPKEWLNKIK